MSVEQVNGLDDALDENLRLALVSRMCLINSTRR